MYQLAHDPSVVSSVSIGDLDITGNQVTVEATINRTQTYVPGTGNNTEGDVVSKHNGPEDVNYLLRPDHAYVTTTDGFFGTPGICDIQLNKTYHVAMVYDGATLKFYRDGFLMSQVAATGNLFQNNWDTRFGLYENGAFTTQFIGYINEVRIWNVARTQAQIQTYMNTSLPSPTTQLGLLAYYTFDDLLNKQGNATFNGTIVGSASINQTNTSCAFVVDTCAIVLPVGLTDFTASVFQKKAIKLTWHTEEEMGISSYTVQRSEDANFNNFSNLGTIVASGGSHSNDYSFSDNNVSVNKLYFYRIQINPVASGKSYSTIKSASISGQLTSADFFPNPTPEGLVNVRFNNISGSTTLSVINSIGQVLLIKKMNVSPGSMVSVDLRKYEKGSYFIQVVTPTNKIMKKIVRL